MTRGDGRVHRQASRGKQNILQQHNSRSSPRGPREGNWPMTVRDENQEKTAPRHPFPLWLLELEQPGLVPALPDQNKASRDGDRRRRMAGLADRALAHRGPASGLAKRKGCPPPPRGQGSQQTIRRGPIIYHAGGVKCSRGLNSMIIPFCDSHGHVRAVVASSLYPPCFPLSERWRLFLASASA
ncbi:hypothetical protein S40285_10571 [Stachybotrys chlorohalonatus IBT 40285]|uniref:Uncharacterized protein n=1 Tax=Stachybotrys chlorohalonatus (strain IBT 40285) TaxID=1283841 RepID=A0A084QJY4_STAC4|nr:hypothetical protein S40285_10571 [Stachybotrys chlorohalonata IBT 40285]